MALRQRIQPAEQAHGIPVFLEQLINRLRVDAGALSDAALGGDPEITASATEHGDELLRGGFTVDAVVRDYGDLGQAVTELAAELESAVTVDEFRELNRCLDNAIAGAVTEYGRQRDEVRFADGLHACDAEGKLLAVEREAVRAARHELSELVRLSPVPTVIWRGPDHIYAVVNEAHDRMLGRSVLGQTIREAHSTAEAGHVPAMLDRVYRTAQPSIAKAVAYTVTGDDGRPRSVWLHEWFHPFLDLGGKVAGILGVSQDITTEVLAARELSAVLNALPLYVARVDAQERVVFASDNISSHVTRAQRTGGTTLRAVLGTQYGGVARYIASALHGEPVEFPWSSPAADAQRSHHYIVHLSPERRVDGTVQGFVACMFNVDTLKLAKLELEDSLLAVSLQTTSLAEERELRERFVSTLSHDLRTPLAAARLASHLLTEQPTDTHAIGRLAALIATNVDRADQMIVDLLDANRLHAGEQLDVEIEACVLNELAAETLAALGPRFQLRANGQVQGYWDRSGMRRVLDNLCGNAIKYGARDTIVTVRLARHQGFALIEVHNQGAPISPLDQATLFEQHRRTNAARTSGHKGWGLGLALVRAITEAHGGRVEVESSEVHGTTFRVRVPLDARKPAVDGAAA
ncbi:MAG: ATP-binding protein [Myxococcota bacterium]|nr:ATP-binding protein [Myxococcota bacterium]